MSVPVTAAVVVVLAGVIAVLSMAELVLAHTTRARAAALEDEGHAEASRLLGLLGRRQTSVAVLVVVRHAAQIAAVTLVVLRASWSDLEPWAWIGVVAGVVVALTTLEAVAKTMALVRTARVARRVVPIADAVVRVPLLAPIGEFVSRRIRTRTPDAPDEETVPRISEEELLAFAGVAVEAEVIEEEEQELIASIIEFGDTIVREVMVPRPDMITVDASFRVADAMEVVILNGFSRLPVTGRNIDDIVGLAYAKDLMRAERDGRGDDAVRSHVRDVRVVPEQQRIAALLPEMQAQQFHMAIVVDEYGGVAGLVTMEDLIEELVGEIVDEFDVEDPMVEPLPGGSFQVNARMPLDEVNELLDADLPEGDWDTLGGLLFGVLGHVPVNGEAIELDQLRLTASRVQGRRISQVRVDRLPPADPPVEADAS